MTGVQTCALPIFARLETRSAGLQELVKSNQTEIVRINGDLQSVRTERDRSTNQSALYQDAYDKLKATYIQQNQAIQKQNEGVEALRKLAEERNALATRVNDQTRQIQQINADYNKLVDDYNKVVRKVKDQAEKK